MFYSQDVQDTRRLFFASWQKYQRGLTLLPLEKQIVDVIILHPEYHRLLETSAPADALVFSPELGESNPFLHMGLHLAVREQIATDRPFGIKKIYQRLLKRYKTPAEVEHLFMELLAEVLWLAQRNQTVPDEVCYFQMCEQLLSKG